MTRFFVGCALVIALEAIASAQGAPGGATIGPFDPDNAVAPISEVEGPGVKIGEGTVLRPVFGIEGGYISNVFYTSSNPVGAGVLRLLAQIGTSSLPDSRLAPASGGDSGGDIDRGSLQYRAFIGAAYDFMLSGNDAVTATDGLSLDGEFHGLVNPTGRLSFGIDEDYTRLIRAANFETNANTNRDINTLALSLIYHPQDHALSGNLYFVNTIDVFERSSQGFADRMFNKLGVRPAWQILPQTSLYLDVSESIVTAIGSTASTGAQKVTSFPLTALAGISTLLNLETTLNLFAGYTNGFYSSGPSFSAPEIGAQLGYRYSPFGRVTLQYQLQYSDSVNANYYRDHGIQLSIQHAVKPIVLMLQPEIHFREYDGITEVIGAPVRDDIIFAVVAGAHYVLRSWLDVTLDYRFTADETDYRYQSTVGAPLTDPSYLRHEVMLGVRGAL